MDTLSDEGDLYSDEDESQYIQSGSTNASGSDSGGRNDRNIPSAADRRAHHNALERKRRDHIKDSFSSLRDSVPSLHGEKASRAQILKKAAEYIQFMRKKNNNIVIDIENIKEQNRLLEEQINNFEKRGMTLSPTPSSASSTPTQAALLSPNHSNNSNSLYSTGVQSLLSIGGGSTSITSDSVNGIANASAVAANAAVTTSPTISFGDVSENSNESNLTSNSDLNSGASNARLTDSPILSQSSTIVQRQSTTGRAINVTSSRQPLTTQQAQLLINGTNSTATIRSVVKNGSSTIIVQNPQMNRSANATNGAHVIHVPSNTSTATATPIIISAASLVNTNGTNVSMATNGNTTYRVLNAKTSASNSPSAAISFTPTTVTTAAAAANGAYRTVLVQPANATLATQQSSAAAAGTTTPNIHIVSTIPTAYSGRVVGTTSSGTTKRFKISTSSTTATTESTEINNNNSKKNSNTSSSSSSSTMINSSSSSSTNAANASNNSKSYNITSVSS